jgi:superoxide dismutase, Cu-Zn family
MKRTEIRHFLLLAAAILVPLLLALAALAVVGIPRASGATVMGTAGLRLADGTPIGTVTADLRLPRAGVALRTFHGFHIHANDNAANGSGCAADPRAVPSSWFLSADGHLKRVADEVHGAHAGDLPSLHINLDGTVRAEFTIDRVQPGELFDRAVVLHAGADNFANVPLGDASTQYRPNATDAMVATGNTGNSGDRLACGVIDVTRG